MKKAHLRGLKNHRVANVLLKIQSHHIPPFVGAPTTGKPIQSDVDIGCLL